MTAFEDFLAQQWANTIKPDLFEHAESSVCPLQIVLGGQPGAGKTNASELIRCTLYPGDNITALDVDSLRKYHPDYKNLMVNHPFEMSGVTNTAALTWFHASIDHARQQRYSMMAEGTWSQPHMPLDIARKAHYAGYDVVGVVIAVPAVVSRQSILQRYYLKKEADKEARWTPMFVHEAAVQSLPDSVEMLAGSAYFDRFIVVNRNMDILFDGTLDMADRDLHARRVYVDEVNRRLSIVEAEKYLATHYYLLDSHKIHTASYPEACEIWDTICTHDVPGIEHDLQLQRAYAKIDEMAASDTNNAVCGSVNNYELANAYDLTNSYDPMAVYNVANAYDLEQLNDRVVYRER